MAERNEAYIVSACRTAVGTLHGGLGSVTAPQLGAMAIKEAIKRAKINAADIEEVVIAGAFGSYMLPEHAMGIGMLPIVPLERVKVIGNAAGTGACLMLANIDARREAEELAKQIEYLELTIYPEFSIFYAKGIQA